MARNRLPMEETVRGEIFARLKTYASQHNTIPNMHSFYQHVLKPEGYDIALSTFRWHWDQLFIDGYLHRDPRTGGLIITGVKIQVLTEFAS